MASEAPTPFNDPAKPILAADPAINDDQRADLWDAFHNSKSADELTQHLQSEQHLAVPDDTKKRLFAAKQASMPAPDPIAKTTAVMTQLSQIDPKVLDISEAHPNVLKLLSTAAGIGAKPAGDGSGASKASAQGKPSKDAKSASAVTADGQNTPVTADYPATPSGHAFVRASDGGHYHIPSENVDKAKQIDPQLQVLHVEP